jgi:para-nitrobenzyl esterase
MKSKIRNQKSKIPMKWLAFALLLLLTISASSQIATTEFGDVQGNMNGSVYEFLGIPYATPPVGDLRWKAPINPGPWDGVLNTTEFAPVCPQKQFDQGGGEGVVVGDESCLFLNIWTPELNTSNLPVMVFIHGGGNQQGGASEINGGALMYEGKNLAERGNNVVVTIQYRLGPLGFLVHPGLENENANGLSGNYAVLDQILALQWIQNNIAAFGGDPNRVMIFGESAGGVNVGNLMNSPLASGLFHRACIQSATPVVDTYANGEARGIEYVNQYSVASSVDDQILYMRSLPSDSLVKYEEPPLSGGAVGMNWAAIMDNVTFTNFPYQNFQNGTFNQVPLMIGSNSEEMSLSAPQTVTPQMVTALINLYVPTDLQDEAFLLYPPGNTNEGARISYIGILSDAQFTVTTRRTAQCVSANQEAPVYRYFFTHKHSIAALEALGSYHGMELFYVFNTWENATLGSGPFFSDADDAVQTNMLQYWSNFAATGNPNGTQLVEWPEYNADTDCYLEIKATPDGTQCGLRTAECDLWDESINYVACENDVWICEYKQSGIQIFPNPTRNFIKVDLPNSNNATITLRNQLGQIELSTSNTSIDLSEYPSGMYTLTIQQGDNISTQIVVKQ